MINTLALKNTRNSDTLVSFYLSYMSVIAMYGTRHTIRELHSISKQETLNKLDRDSAKSIACSTLKFTITGYSKEFDFAEN